MSTSQQPLPEAPESAYANGLTAFESGDFSVAAEYFASCLATTEDPRLLRLAKGYLTDSYARIGADALRETEFQSALTAYEHAIASAPSYPDLHMGRARALAGLGRREEQRFELALVLQLNPRYVDALLANAAFLYEEARNAEAWAQFEAACQVDTDLYGSAYQEVRNLVQKGDIPAAIVILVAQRSPGAIQANQLAKLAREHVRNGRSKLAQETYQLALLLAPSYPDLHCKLGQVLLEMQEFSDATAHLRKAIELHPRYVEALSYLGVALLRQGSNEGTEYLARALELDPFHPVALQEYGRSPVRRSGR